MKSKKENKTRLVLIEFATMSGDKHSFAFFEGREQIKLSTCDPDKLDHEETIDALKDWFEDD